MNSLLKSRLDEGNRIAERCREWCSLGIVVGSVTTTPDAFRPTSDVDILLATKDITTATHHLPFLNDSQRADACALLSGGLVDGLSMKGSFGEIVLSLSVLSEESFARSLAVKEGTLRYYRTTSNAKQILMLSFGGASIRHDISCEPHGSGFIAVEPILLEKGGTPYLGVSLDCFLGLVSVFFDRWGFHYRYKEFWRSIVDLCQKTTGSTEDRLVEAVLAAKIKRDALSGEAVAHIRHMVSWALTSRIGKDT